MACAAEIMDREMAFMDAVQRTRDLRSGRDGMSLIDADGGVLATFVAGGDE